MSRLSRRTFLAGVGAGSAWFSVRGAFAQELVLTPAQTLGPYYPNQMPLDRDNDLIVIGDAITPAVGTISWVGGRILDRRGDPIRGALVEIWQADHNGAYIHTASPIANRDPFFQGYGKFATGSTGEYLFRTVKPGLYPGRTRHIHYQVTYPGGRTFTTQLYVQGDPLNATDGVLNGITNAVQRSSVIVPWVEAPDSPIGELSAVFDIILDYTPSDSPTGSTPAIFAMNGVVHGASLQPVAAAGSWISIFGSNLAPASRIWTSSEIVDGRLPASLDGVSVSVNDQPAAVYYISPSQLNVEVPSDISGTAQVKVTTAVGTTTGSVEVQTRQPGFFLYAGNYVAAVRSDGAYIGPANLMSGIETVPAKPGDVLMLFGTGFGPTSPAVPAGEVVTQNVPLAAPVRVRIDAADLEVLYAGMTAAGLYQINVRIPELSDGDRAITAETGGVWTQSFAKLRVQR